MKRISRIAPLAIAVLAAACQSAAGPGHIDVALSGTQPTSSGSEVASVIVTVKEIDLEVRGKGWVPVVTTPQTIDLLALDGKPLTTLGVAQLPAGRVKGMRFLLDDAGAKVILKDGKTAKLELPDHGVLQVKGSFHVGPCAAGTVLVDFDPKLEKERDRKTGAVEYALRCKAHVKTESTTSTCDGPDGGGAGGSDGGRRDGGGGDPCAGVVCAPGESCVGGQCVADPCFGVVCAPGERCDNGVCVSGSANPDLGGGGTGGGGTSGGGSDGGCHRR